MAFSISMGQAVPSQQILELVSVGTEDFKRGLLSLDDSSSDQKKIFNNFLSVVGCYATVNIINSEHNFTDVIVVANKTIELDIIDVDYSSLTPAKRAKIDAFAGLLLSIAE